MILVFSDGNYGFRPFSSERKVYPLSDMKHAVSTTFCVGAAGVFPENPLKIFDARARVARKHLCLSSQTPPFSL